MKNTLWEGGLRVAAFVWSPMLKSRRRVSHQLMHVCDWLPTLLHAVGANTSSLGHLDGVNMWPSLSDGAKSPRKELLHNIDLDGKVYSIRIGDFKLVAPNWDYRDRFGWYAPEQAQFGPLRFEPRDGGEISRSAGAFPESVPEYELSAEEREMTLEQIAAKLDAISAKRYPTKAIRKDVVDCGEKPANASTNCRPGRPCLYHVTSDPCEYRNLYADEPEVVRLMYTRVLAHNATAVPRKNCPEDPRGFPVNNGWAWSPWVNLDN